MDGNSRMVGKGLPGIHEQRAGLPKVGAKTDIDLMGMAWGTHSRAVSYAMLSALALIRAAKTPFFLNSGFAGMTEIEQSLVCTLHSFHWSHTPWCAVRTNAP